MVSWLCVSVVIWTRFLFISCGILSLSAANPTFRNCFVKVYIAGVFRRIEPHGQVSNDVDMDRVLLAQSNSLEEAIVNGGQSGGQLKSSTVIKLYFSPCEALRGCSYISGDNLTPVDCSMNRIQQPPSKDWTFTAAIILNLGTWLFTCLLSAQNVGKRLCILYINNAFSYAY